MEWSQAPINILVLVPVALLFATALLLGRNEVVHRTVRCPSTGTRVDVDVVQRAGHPEKPVRVKACSLLPGRKIVDCGQACIAHAA